MRAKTLPFLAQRQKRGVAECRKALKTRSKKVAWSVPSLPAVTPLTASAPTFHRLPFASEAQSTAAVPARNPESDFAALINSFTDTAPSESAAPAPAAPAKNANAALIQTPAAETLPAKGGKADSLNLDEASDLKLSDHEPGDEAPASLIAVDVTPVKLNQPVLPFIFGWNSGATNLVQSVHEAAQGKRVEGQAEVPAPVTPAAATAASQPIVSAPQSDAAAKAVRLDAQAPEELTSALTMRDLVPASNAPKAALAFEAHLRPNNNVVAETIPASASLTAPQTPAGQHELNPTAAHELSRAAVPYPVEPAKPVEHSNRKEPDRAGQIAQQSKSESVSEAASKGSSDSARQDHSDSRDRKSGADDITSQTPARHSFDPIAEAGMATATAPRTSVKQTESARPAEKHSPAAATTQNVPDGAAPRTEPARDISFRIGSASADAVDIKLTERAGQVRVAVHSADPALTRSLQANVTELAGKLEKSGFHSETFLPHGAEGSREPQANPNFQDSPKDRRAPHYEPPRPKKRSNETDFQINMLTSNHQENS